MHGSGKILVIDDDEEYLSYVATVLRDARIGHNLASSAYVAKKVIKENRPPIILTDLRLPGSSGIELLKLAIKQDPTTVVVVMTAFATVNSALECLKYGAYDYMIKPSSAEEIAAMMKRTIEHRQIRIELIQKTAQIETFKKEYVQTNKMVESYSAALAPLMSRSDIPVDVRAKLEHLRLRIMRRELPED